MLDLLEYIQFLSFGRNILPRNLGIIFKAYLAGKVLDTVQILVVVAVLLRKELDKEVAGLEHPKLFVEVLLRILEQVIICKVSVAAFETGSKPVGVIRYEGINAIVRDEGEIPTVSVDEQAFVLPSLFNRYVLCDESSWIAPLKSDLRWLAFGIRDLDWSIQ